MRGSEGEKFLCTYLGLFGVYSTENLMAIQNIYMIKGFGVELAELCVENGVFGVGHLGFRSLFGPNKKGAGEKRCDLDSLRLNECL